jgi:ABC-2 type transport system ATP-binding protein
LIEFRNVSKRYADAVALQEVSFALKPGEVFGYIGPNGAGKTTTLRILTGLTSGYTGTVTLDGADVEKRRGTLHRSIGYLPQDGGFQEWRTTRRTLMTFGRLSGLDARKLPRRVRAVLDLLAISEYADRRIVHLSGGTRQKLLFAQAILHDPQVLILDEPLSGLDPASRHQMKRIMKVTAEEGRTVLLSSHVLADVEDLADRIAILHRGRIADTGTPAELRAAYQRGVVVEVTATAPLRPDDSVFSRIPTVERAEQGSPESIRLHFAAGTDADEAIRLVMAPLSESTRGIRQVRQVEPSLEEIYLSLTEGR